MLDFIHHFLEEVTFLNEDNIIREVEVRVKEVCNRWYVLIEWDTSEMSIAWAH